MVAAEQGGYESLRGGRRGFLWAPVIPLYCYLFRNILSLCIALSPFHAFYVICSPHRDGSCPHSFLALSFYASYTFRFNPQIIRMRRSIVILTASLLLAASATASQHPLQSTLSTPSDPSFPPPGSLLNPDRVSIDNPKAPGMTLADALTLERKATVWWEYARDVSSVVRPVFCLLPLL